MGKHYHVRKTKSPPTNYSSESFNLCATTCTMKLNIIPLAYNLITFVEPSATFTNKSIPTIIKDLGEV